MIRPATADDIKQIVRCLQQQADRLGWEFDPDQALDNVRRQCVLANSTVLIAEMNREITGLLFAVLTTTGFNPRIQAQITNIWVRDDDADRAQLLVDTFVADLEGVDEVLISQWHGQEFDLRDQEPIITTYRIR